MRSSTAPFPLRQVRTAGDCCTMSPSPQRHRAAVQEVCTTAIPPEELLVGPEQGDKSQGRDEVRRAELAASLRGCSRGGWDAAALPTAHGTLTQMAPELGQALFFHGKGRFCLGWVCRGLHNRSNEGQQRFSSLSAQYPVPRSQ